MEETKWDKNRYLLLMFKVEKQGQNDEMRLLLPVPPLQHALPARPAQRLHNPATISEEDILCYPFVLYLAFIYCRKRLISVQVQFSPVQLQHQFQGHFAGPQSTEKTVRLDEQTFHSNSSWHINLKKIPVMEVKSWQIRGSPPRFCLDTTFKDTLARPLSSPKDKQKTKYQHQQTERRIHVQ